MLPEPTVTMLYATCIVQDEATGVTYHGHTDCLSGESGPWEPLHCGHPPRTHCGGHHQSPLGGEGGWLPWNRVTMAVLALTHFKTMQIPY